MSAQLPRWLNELIDSCPAAGDGVHYWLFRVARHLAVHMGDEEIFALLTAKSTGCGRVVTAGEIISQIKGARAHSWQPEHPKSFAHGSDLPPLQECPLALSHRAWPKPEPEKIRRLVASGEGLYDLFERSPLRYGESTSSYAEEIIDILFPGNPLLCVGKSQSQSVTRRREPWRGRLHRMQFVVPNPMLDVWGHTKTTQKLSQHTLEQTAARVYLVVEFDFSEFARDGVTLSHWAPLVRQWHEEDITVADACAALHLHLANFLPLVAAVHSGGKSLHGWYYVFGWSETELRDFMSYAVRLGADRATWTRSQFTRVPDGLRENGERQITYYLDPTKAVKDE